MTTYGKRSFWVSFLLIVPFIGFACYLAITDKVGLSYKLLAAASLIILPVLVYKEYFIITLTSDALIVSWPLKRKKYTYLLKDISIVQISKTAEKSRSTTSTLLVTKTDNTVDKHILPDLFFERKRLLKDLSKYIKLL